MNRLLTISVLGLLVCVTSYKVQCQPSVINSSGNPSNNNPQLSWSIGEPAVLTLTNNDIILTQGFIQPLDSIDEIEIFAAEGHIDNACLETGASINVTVTGGVPPYNYLWSNGQISEDLENIGAGNYSLKIVDALGSNLILNFEVQTNDDINYAHVLPNIREWCSPLAGYCNIGSTPDQSGSSCLGNTAKNNVWFLFTPTTNTLQVKLNVGDDQGTLKLPIISIWTKDLSEEILCVSSSNQIEDISFATNQLVPGTPYYLSVDNNSQGNNSNQGTFSLCVSDSLTFDFSYGALDITDSINSNNGLWVSAPFMLSNREASPDLQENIAPCWNPSRKTKNVWFKFSASSSVADIKLATGISEGTLKFPQITLWDESLENVVICDISAQQDDIVLTSINLTQNSIYYLEVDNRDIGNTDNSGSFQLSINYPLLTGINEKNVYHFPNPSSNKITLNINPLQIEEIEVFSIKGKHLGTLQFQQTGIESIVNIERLKPGMYLMQVKQKNRKNTPIKFIKE